MTFLIDTHVLLWWLADPGLLSEDAREAFLEPSHTIVVSSIVVWEIAMKRSLHKLDAPDDLEEAISDAGFRVLPVTIDHALATESLPWHHRDPFDRMLIAQAITEGMTFLSRDKQVQKYNVPIVRA